MKTNIFVVCFTLLFLFAGTSNATGPAQIYDEYYGHGIDKPDVNGSKTIYDIYRMSVFVHLDGSLSINILSNYLHTVGINQALTDVFISTGVWKPNAEKDHFETDNYLTGEQWEYVISIAPESRNSLKGKVLMYPLTKPYEINDKGTELVYSTGTVLLSGKQETIYIPNKDEKNVGIGNFFIGGLDTKNTADDFLSIYVNTNENEFKCIPLAVHYSSDMDANDIIEGNVPNLCREKATPYLPQEPPTLVASVPEFSTLILIVFGLLGICVSKGHLQKSGCQFNLRITKSVKK